MGLSKISVVLICALWFLMVHSCHAQDPTSMLTQAPMSNLIPAPVIQGDKTPDKDDKTPDKDKDDKSKEDKTSDKDNKTPDKDNKNKDTDDKTDDRTSDKDDKTKDKEDKTPEKDKDKKTKDKEDKTPEKDKDKKTKDKEDKTPEKDKDKKTKDTDDKTPEKDDKPKDMDDKTPDKDKSQQPKDTHKSNDKNLDNKTPKPKDSAPEPQGVPQPQGAPERRPEAISPTASENSPQDWVEAHNAHRRLENVVLMTWNVSLAQYAQTYVKTIAPTCKPKHSGGPWGECLFMGDGAATAKEIVDYWASEQKYWDPKTKKCADGQDCGHYLQVVNPNSPAVGCGKAKCANDPFYWFVICDYIW